MITIDFALSHSSIRIVSRKLVTSKSKNYVKAHFDLLSDDWTAPITAIFRADNNAYSVLLDGENSCMIPWEVLETAGTVNVSAFCGDRHTANIAQFMVVQSGYTDGETPSDPTPTVYEQILEQYNGKQDKLIAGDGIKIENNVISTVGGSSGADGKSAYEIALEHGFIGSEEDWLKSLKGTDGAKGDKGEQGEQGIQGEKGQDGADGKTPVKGVDYFTAEDKTEFTAEVTESLKPEFVKKQDKLTAGENITISKENVISATGGTDDYTELSNKPSINNVALSGNKSSDDLNLQGKLTAGDNITIKDNVISAEGGSAQIVSGVVNANGTITFTDSEGNSFTTSGESVIGADGFSPSATVQQTASGATITVTDKSGTTTANISNGAPGQDYVLTAQDKDDIADIVLAEFTGSIVNGELNTR